MQQQCGWAGMLRGSAWLFWGGRGKQDFHGQRVLFKIIFKKSYMSKWGEFPALLQVSLPAPWGKTATLMLNGPQTLKPPLALVWWVYGYHLCVPFSFSAERDFGKKGSPCGCSALEHPGGLGLR